MKTETQIREEIEGLRNLTTAQLKQKYREVFGCVNLSGDAATARPQRRDFRVFIIGRV
ncbi:MAG: hypothetical protein ACUVS7_16785 [Bryobacteraceae bacterium]